MTDKVNIMTDDGSDAQFINQAIAAKIKEHRKRLKLSLDALSKKGFCRKVMLMYKLTDFQTQLGCKRVEFIPNR